MQALRGRAPAAICSAAQNCVCWLHYAWTPRCQRLRACAVCVASMSPLPTRSMHVCTQACRHVCIYASMRLCVYASMHLCMYASMHVCIYAKCVSAGREALSFQAPRGGGLSTRQRHVYVCVCVYIYLSIYPYIYIYIERERERKKERDMCCICIIYTPRYTCIHVYLGMYTCRGM